MTIRQSARFGEVQRQTETPIVAWFISVSTLVLTDSPEIRGDRSVQRPLVSIGIYFNTKHLFIQNYVKNNNWICNPV